MSERARKKNGACISEEDIATVLQRYPVTTVLALLKEVARFPGAKLDWKELVKNTETGISNAREYQMLWRHLAYRQTLLDKPEDRAEPLDDDSDLEYELAAFPHVSLEASAEAAACVKVMMESGTSDSGNPGCTMVEAPLMINIPNGHSSNVPSENSKTPCSMQGMNITVPICVQKLPISSIPSTEGLDACGTAGGNMPPRRKRKAWTEAEDAELFAAVQKYGEGSWANISKTDFKGDRTASQLSQRWASIRKKTGNSNVGRVNPLPGPQLSEAQLAARNAMNLALNPPVKKLTSSSSVVPAGTGLKAASNNSVRPPNIESGSILQAAHQCQQGPIPSKSSPMGTLGLSPKSRSIAKRPSAKSIYNSDSKVIATAVAAGARIATQSVADSVIKAAKNVHIMPTGGATTHLPGHPNVHYIRTGRAATPHLMHPSVMNASTCSGPTRTAPPTIQRSSSISSILSNVSSKQTNGISTSLAAESPQQDVKTTEENKVSQMGNAPKGKVQDDGASVADSSGNNASKEQAQKDGAHVADAPSKNVHKEQVQQDGGRVVEAQSKNVLKEQVQQDGGCVVGAPSNQVGEDTTTLSTQAGLNEGTVAEDLLELTTAVSKRVCVVDSLNNQIREDKTASSKQAGLKEETIAKDLLNLKTTESNGACVVDAPSSQVEEDKTTLLQQAVTKEGTIDEDLLNLKTTVSNEACVVDAPSNQVEEDKTASLKQAVLKEGTIAEDLLNLKLTVSNEACVVDAPSNQVEEDKTATLKQAGLKEETIAEDLLNLKTTVSNETAAVAKKAEESQDSSQNDSKTEVSHDANQDKDKVKECHDANQRKNKAKGSPNTNQNSNNAKESQDANVVCDS